MANAEQRIKDLEKRVNDLTSIVKHLGYGNILADDDSLPKIQTFPSAGTQFSHNSMFGPGTGFGNSMFGQTAFLGTAKSGSFGSTENSSGFQRESEKEFWRENRPTADSIDHFDTKSFEGKKKMYL